MTLLVFSANAVEPTFKELYDSAVRNYNLKKYDEGLQDIDKAIKLTASEPEKSQAFQSGLGCYYLGDVYCIMNKDDDAIAAFAKPFDLKDSHPHHKTFAIVRSAEILNKNGKIGEALLMLNKLDAVVGSHPDWAARGKILAGSILLKQGKKDEAKKQFEAAVNMKGVSANWTKQEKDELDKAK